MHLEIKLPTLQGRKDILGILLRTMLEDKLLDPEVADAAISQLSLKTEGWSGADLSGLVRSAVAFALDRSVGAAEADVSLEQSSDDDLSDRSKALITTSTIKLSILAKDLENGFLEISRTKNLNFGLFKRIRKTISSKITKILSR